MPSRLVLIRHLLKTLQINSIALDDHGSFWHTPRHQILAHGIGETHNHAAPLAIGDKSPPAPPRERVEFQNHGDVDAQEPVKQCGGACVKEIEGSIISERTPQRVQIESVEHEQPEHSGQPRTRDGVEVPQMLQPNLPPRPVVGPVIFGDDIAPVGREERDLMMQIDERVAHRRDLMPMGPLTRQPDIRAVGDAHGAQDTRETALFTVQRMCGIIEP